MTILETTTPRSVYIEIIDGCNLRCDYCYIGQVRNHEERQRSDSAVTRAHLQELRSHGTQEVVFLGGEPTLHPHLPDLISAAGALGFESVGIITNGTAHRSKVVEALASHGCWVDVTMRAFRQTTWEKLTKSTIPLATVVRNIDRYLNAGVEVGIEIDVTPEILDELPDGLRTFLRRTSRRVQSVRLHRIAPTGDAASRPDPRISSREWNVLLRALDAVSKEARIPVALEDGLPLCVLDSDLWHMAAPCECGRDFMTLSGAGRLRDCPCRQDVVPLWPRRKDADLTAMSREVRQLVAAMPVHPECTGCEVLDVCRGGCRASVGFSASFDQFEDEFVAFTSLGSTERKSLAAKPSGFFLQLPTKGTGCSM